MNVVIFEMNAFAPKAVAAEVGMAAPACGDSTRSVVDALIRAVKKFFPPVETSDDVIVGVFVDNQTWIGGPPPLTTDLKAGE